MSKGKDTGLLWETLMAPPTTGSSTESRAGNRAGRSRRLPYDKRCVGITKAGRRCRGRIRQGSEFCSFHDPTLTAERRRRNAAKGGRSHHRLANLPDGYLRKLTSRRAVGEAMDRLYREVRLGVITPEMGSVLLAILTRILDSEFGDQGATSRASRRPSKADRLRPKLAELLTREERRAWRKAVANAPAAFVRNKAARKDVPQPPAKGAKQGKSADGSDTAIRLAVTAAS